MSFQLHELQMKNEEKKSMILTQEMETKTQILDLELELLKVKQVYT